MPALNALRIVLLLFLSMVMITARAVELPQGIIKQEGRPAPPLKLADMDGNVTDLKELRGKWVFVHFWASWCGPCRREMPLLQVLPEKLDQERFEMMLINTAEDEDTVFTFMASVAPELNSLMDRDGLVTEAWGPRGLPATYLVGPEGRIWYQALGGRAWSEGEYLSFLKEIINDGK